MGQLSVRPQMVGVLGALVSLLIAGYGAYAQDGTPAASPVATPEAPLTVALRDETGTEVGTATLTEEAGQVSMRVAVEGFEPGDHGIHIHENGVCNPEADPPFSTAGDHFNPTGAMHGAPDDDTAHAGDLGNITVAEEGAGEVEITTDRVTLEEGAETSLRDADGSALVIHAGPDDEQTDPDGNSGSRIACGVIAAPVEATPAAGTPATGATADQVTVVSYDIYFEPVEVTIPADTDVTFVLPNEGEIPHTFTIDELDIDVYLDGGESAEITVNAPAGEYTFYCKIEGHSAAGMVGTLTVG